MPRSFFLPATHSSLFMFTSLFYFYKIIDFSHKIYPDFHCAFHFQEAWLLKGSETDYPPVLTALHSIVHVAKCDWIIPRAPSSRSSRFLWFMLAIRNANSSVLQSGAAWLLPFIYHFPSFVYYTHLGAILHLSSTLFMHD